MGFPVEGCSALGLKRLKFMMPCSLETELEKVGMHPITLTPRYLLYRVLEPLGPYIVGTWGVRVTC